MSFARAIFSFLGLGTASFAIYFVSQRSNIPLKQIELSSVIDKKQEKDDERKGIELFATQAEEQKFPSVVDSTKQSTRSRNSLAAINSLILNQHLKILSLLQ